MRIDDLSDKSIHLAKCIIYPTGKAGLYTINQVARVAAIGPSLVLTGANSQYGHYQLTPLNNALIGRDVALVKESVFGNTVIYQVLDLSTISLPTHMGGNIDSIWPRFD